VQCRAIVSRKAADLRRDERRSHSARTCRAHKRRENSRSQRWFEISSRNARRNNRRLRFSFFRKPREERFPHRIALRTRGCAGKKSGGHFRLPSGGRFV
jgi:hypothetical protein